MSGKLYDQIFERFRVETRMALGSIPKDVRKSVKQEAIIEEKGSVWIFGESGNGKTLTAARKAWNICKGDLEEDSISWTSPIDCRDIVACMSYDLCRAFQDASLRHEEYVPQKDYLYVIDDIDKIKMTDFREEQLFRFFDICLKLDIKLIVTSQICIQDFASMFSGSFVVAMERRLSQTFKEMEL